MDEGIIMNIDKTEVVILTRCELCPCDVTREVKDNIITIKCKETKCIMQVIKRGVETYNYLNERRS